MVPAGGYFDTNIVSMDEWHSFHQWQMTDEELRIYLKESLFMSFNRFEVERMMTIVRRANQEEESDGNA